MSGSILYSSAFCTIDGAVMAEAASLRINKNPNLNHVLTLAKGFAGVMVGAGICEVTMETAVPAKDFELNPDPYMVTGKQVLFGAVMANRQMQEQMFISGAEYQAAVNQASRLSISLVGPLAPWE